MSKSVKYNTTSQWSQHTRLLKAKSNLNKINESLDWFGTEMSSRNRIKTRNWKKPSASYMSKSVNYNTTSQWSQHTNKYKVSNLNKINGMIRDWNVLQKPNQNQKLKETICIIEICPNQWITTLLPNDPNIHVSKESYTSHKHKVSNLNKINESLEWFGTEMSSRNRIKTRNWKKPSAS